MQLLHTEGDEKMISSSATPIHCKVFHIFRYKLNIYSTEPLKNLLIKYLRRYWYNSSYDNERVVTMVTILLFGSSLMNGIAFCI
jgi:hypothetical protein